MPRKFGIDAIEKLKEGSLQSGDIENAEQQVRLWVEQFIEDLSEIDRFYSKNICERIERFVELQAQYYSKSDKKHKHVLICPITGENIVVDKAGQISKLSLIKLQRDLQTQTFAHTQSFLVVNQTDFKFRSLLQDQDHPIFEKLHIKVNKPTKSEDQDEMDHATNWVRAFQKIYTEIKWLNSYAIINEIAAQKV